ncbi:MAG: hypothetical protein VX026_06470, partial [Myxococcota bacterium]|nr:hypothetical protein [Myxococcota bacterium]
LFVLLLCHLVSFAYHNCVMVFVDCYEGQLFKSCQQSTKGVSDISIESDADNGSLGRKYFIESSGAERPRPISLKKSDQTGLYFINEYSSMYVDVQSPPSGQETFH